MGFSIKGGFARLIGHIFYDKAYLKGRHFSGSYSNGWRNVMRYFFIQKIIGINRGVPFPVDFRMQVANWKNIIFDPDEMNVFFKIGNYYQAMDAKIYIGKGVQIANGVAIVSSNHDLMDISVHTEGKDVVIGRSGGSRRLKKLPRRLVRHRRHPCQGHQKTRSSRRRAERPAGN